jgi:hypothetical protein
MSRTPEALPDVFMLWAIPIGLIVGRLLGGRVERLSALHFRWGALAVAGLLVQAVLFTPAGGALAGGLVPLLYVASTAAVLVAVLANLRIPGMALVVLGSVSNLAAVVANGGSMPADPAALALAGFSGPGENTNSVVVAQPALQPLTDIYAVPAWVPFANVFSVGDVLIAIGIVIAIVAAMRRDLTAAGPNALEAAAG